MRKRQKEALAAAEAAAKAPPPAPAPKPPKAAKIVGKTGAFLPEYAAKHDWKIDEGLADGIIDMIGNSEGRTIADFGAGTGLYVKHFRRHAYKAQGFDGIPGVENLSGHAVSFCDLSAPRDFRIKWDWVVSLEVGAYIAKEKARTFVGNLVQHCACGVICTWQTPETKGLGHVNPLTDEQLVALFADFGFAPDKALAKFIYRKASRRIRGRVFVFVPAAKLTHK